MVLVGSVAGVVVMSGRLVLGGGVRRRVGGGVGLGRGVVRLGLGVVVRRGGGRGGVTLGGVTRGPGVFSPPRVECLRW